MSEGLVGTSLTEAITGSTPELGARPVLADLLQDWIAQMQDLDLTGVIVSVPHPSTPDQRALSGCHPESLGPLFRGWSHLATSGSAAVTSGLIASFPRLGAILREHGFLTWAAMRTPLPGGTGLEVLMFSPSDGAVVHAAEACWRTLRMADDPWRAAADAVLWLTPRERECLRCALQGMSAEKTGALLGVSSHTVIYHLKNAIEKHKATGKVDAAWRALQLGAL